MQQSEPDSKRGPYRRATLLIYPFLASAYPILLVYSANPMEVAPFDVLKVLLFLGLGLGLSALIIRLAVKDPGKTALATAILGLAFTGYGQLLSHLAPLKVMGIGIWRNKTMIPLIGVLLAWLCRPGLKVPREIHTVLTWMSLALTATCLTQAGLRLLAVQRNRPAILSENLTGSTPTARPNIVFIVLDEYARADSLKEFFQFDNADFLAGLQERGFQVSSRSTCNYPITIASLASILNADYLPAPYNLDTNKPDHDMWLSMISQSRVIRFFKSLGYSVEASSFCSATDHMHVVDTYLRSHFIGAQFWDNLVDASLWNAIGPNSRRKFPAWTRTHRENVLTQLDSLEGIGGSPAPRFTMVHILCPHRPLVFGAEGNDLDQLTLQERDRDYAKLYVDQCRYLNKRVLLGVDQFLAQSPKPVIVIMSDHGSRYGNVVTRLAFTSRDPRYLKERMSNLCAIYFPDSAPKPDIDALSAVNIFRLIINRYFQGNMPLLPTHCYWLDGNAAEVTESVETK